MMKERLYKFTLCLIAAPLMIAALLVSAVLMIFLPLIVLAFPEVIKIDE